MQVLASQLHFLANRNAGLAIPPLFWPVDCIKIGGHVVQLSGPTVYSLYCALDIFSYSPSWLLVNLHATWHVGHAILFSYETMNNIPHLPTYGKYFGFEKGTEKVSNNIWLLVGVALNGLSRLKLIQDRDQFVDLCENIFYVLFKWNELNFCCHFPLSKCPVGEAGRAGCLGFRVWNRKRLGSWLWLGSGLRSGLVVSFSKCFFKYIVFESILHSHAF